MNTQKIDNVSTGVVFVYDADTGDVLWTHEEITEVTGSKNDCQMWISQSECENIRATASQVFPNRKTNVIIAPEGFSLRENIRITVDVNKKTLIEQKDENRSFAERFAEFSSK